MFSSSSYCTFIDDVSCHAPTFNCRNTPPQDPQVDCVCSYAGEDNYAARHQPKTSSEMRCNLVIEPIAMRGPRSAYNMSGHVGIWLMACLAVLRSRLFRYTWQRLLTVYIFYYLGTKIKLYIFNYLNANKSMHVIYSHFCRIFEWNLSQEHLKHAWNASAYRRRNASC